MQRFTGLNCIILPYYSLCHFFCSCCDRSFVIWMHPPLLHSIHILHKNIPQCGEQFDVFMWTTSQALSLLTFWRRIVCKQQVWSVSTADTADILHTFVTKPMKDQAKLRRFAHEQLPLPLSRVNPWQAAWWNNIADREEKEFHRQAWTPHSVHTPTAPPPPHICPSALPHCLLPLSMSKANYTTALRTGQTNSI